MLPEELEVEEVLRVDVSQLIRVRRDQILRIPLHNPLEELQKRVSHLQIVDFALILEVIQIKSLIRLLEHLYILLLEVRLLLKDLSCLLQPSLQASIPLPRHLRHRLPDLNLSLIHIHSQQVILHLIPLHLPQIIRHIRHLHPDKKRHRRLQRVRHRGRQDRYEHIHPEKRIDQAQNRRRQRRQQALMLRNQQNLPLQHQTQHDLYDLIGLKRPKKHLNVVFVHLRLVHIAREVKRNGLGAYIIFDLDVRDVGHGDLIDEIGDVPLLGEAGGRLTSMGMGDFDR